MKLPHTEVKFYPEVKSQTGLISLRVSCKRALSDKSDTRPIDSVPPDEVLEIQLTWLESFHVDLDAGNESITDSLQKN